MTQLNVEDTVGRHDLVAIHDKPVRLPDPEHLHPQFRTVLAANYGKCTDDHWPVDELLALAREERTNR